jgi:hypothetical protein
MRIIGEIDHPSLKITLFKMDNRLSVKFESGFYEQTYKFRTADGLETAEDLRKIVDEGFIQAVNEQFAALHRIKMEALTRHAPPAEEDEFETII